MWPAQADVLVIRDGSRIETRGTWEVKGRLVVFTRSDGSLASLRLRDIDLEASRQATEAAAAKADKEPSLGGKGKSVDGASAQTQPRDAAWVLTDADFSRRRSMAADGESSESEPTPPDGVPTKASPPVVSSYHREADPVDQHVIVSGTVANQTRTTATAISLDVSLFDEQGNLIEMRRAAVDRKVLLPGAESSFRAEFPDVFNYSAIQFRPTSTNLVTGEGKGPEIPGQEDVSGQGGTDDANSGSPPETEGGVGQRR